MGYSISNMVALKAMRRKSLKSARHEMGVHLGINESHPGKRYIVKLLEGFLVDDFPILAFEAFGKELASLLHKQGPLSLPEFKVLGRQMLIALDALHESGFAHGDIKPGNILWDPQRKEGRLIDFGWARMRYRLGEGIATRDYAPPEMLLGLKMTPAVDLWGLGCTLFEAITGEQLFDPYAVCELKYKEFTPDESTGSASASEKEEEPTLKLDAGMLVDGRFVLHSVLGDGKNGDVWLAEPLQTARSATVALEPAAIRERPRTKSESKDHRQKQLNIWEVVVGYEHFLAMQNLCGPFPPSLAKEGKYHYILFNEDGTYRFNPEINPVPLVERLIASKKFDEAAATSIASLLQPMLELEASKRPTPSELLARFDAWTPVDS